MVASSEWSPSSWRSLPAKHQPSYADSVRLERILSEITTYPPLVFSGEVDALKAKLAKTARGDFFLLQGGDCAERFEDCQSAPIMRKLKIMLQMSVILSYGARKPVLRVGRIAGQYAKPRSNDTEVVKGETIPIYRGDAVNSIEPTALARAADPERLKQCYVHSAMTLNYIRALTRGGFADLHNADQWNLDFVSELKHRNHYQAMVEQILNAIAFMESLGTREDRLGWIDFYTSHEGLLLNYEEAQTRFVGDGYYNLGAHMLWIGDRTRAGAHLEYFRGIQNPVGIKVGPSADPRGIIELIKTLNPTNQPGRIVLISRFGKSQAARMLPGFIEGVRAAGLEVVWSVDPMHGNGQTTSDGIKTRNFDEILGEIRDSFAAHAKLGSTLGGVHFELTGDDVTECIGGASGLNAADLKTNYQTYCDPRLNYNQSLEMAFLISSMLNDSRKMN